MAVGDGRYRISSKAVVGDDRGLGIGPNGEIERGGGYFVWKRMSILT